MKTKVESTGRTLRAIVTTVVYKHIIHVRVQYADRSSESHMYRV